MEHLGRTHSRALQPGDRVFSGADSAGGFASALSATVSPLVLKGLLRTVEPLWWPSPSASRAPVRRDSAAKPLPELGLGVDADGADGADGRDPLFSGSADNRIVI